MRFLNWIAAICICSSFALADEKAKTITVPEVVAKVATDFTPGQQTQLSFFSAKKTPISSAFICVGEDCTKGIHTVFARYVTVDNPDVVVNLSQYLYTVDVGTEVMIDYSIDGELNVYRRVFRLAKTKDDKYEFASVKAELHEEVKLSPLTYQQVYDSLSKSGPDNNLNGYADHLDALYYGTEIAGTCANYAWTAYRHVRALGVPARVVYYYRSDGNYHAVIRIFVEGAWRYLEPQLGGALQEPTGETFELVEQ